MNRREENLIRILYEKKNTFVIIKELVEGLGCSDKTIRNSLNKIEEYLIKFSSDLKLVRKRGKGICLKIKEDSRITLNDIIVSNHPNENTLSEDERRFEITYSLLMYTKPITLTKLSEKYYVNKKVIADDLNEIGRQLKKYNLKIVSKQKVGNFIEGLEKDRREALSQSIKNLGELNKTKSTLKSIFMQYEIDLVNKAILDLQDDIGIYFTDESNNALAIHVLFMVKRIKLNQVIKVSARQKDLIEKKLQYSWAVKLAKQLEGNFSIKFPESEICYLAVHLLGVRYYSPNNTEINNFTFESDTNIMDILLNKLIDNVSEISDTSFKSDKTLIEGLRMHLYGSLNRIKYGLSLENPLFEEIKRMNPYLYYEVLDIVDRFNSEYKIHIPKEDVAYITVHFQASIEKNDSSLTRKYSGVVVCHLGMGVSNYLKIKLEKMFPWIDFKGNISIKDIVKYTENNPTDLIFSTVDIDNFGLNYIKISSIIDEAEEIKVKEQVNNKIIKHDLKNEEEILKFIDKKFIFLNKKLNNKAEVIEFITNKLYVQGRVNPEFCKSVLKRELVDSTEIGSLLAIPHGDTDHIISSTICLLTLEKPILWEKEQVQIVVLLAVKKEDYSNDNTMRSFFKHLNNLSNNKESLGKLIKEDNVDNFLEIFKK